MKKLKANENIVCIKTVGTFSKQGRELRSQVSTNLCSLGCSWYSYWHSQDYHVQVETQNLIITKDRQKCIIFRSIDKRIKFLLLAVQTNPGDLIWKVRIFIAFNSAVWHVKEAIFSSLIHHFFIDDWFIDVSLMNYWCLLDETLLASVWKDIENMDETWM